MMSSEYIDSTFLMTHEIRPPEGGEDPGSAISAAAPGRADRWVLYGVHGTSGLAVMAYEMLLGRAFVPHFGGSVFGWGALIGVVLCGVFAGNLAGGRLSARPSATRTASLLFGISTVLMIASAALIDPTCAWLGSLIEDPRWGALCASIVFGLVPCALLASFGPIAAARLVTKTADGGPVVGRLSAANTAGSVAGAIGVPFFLIPNVELGFGFVLVAALCAGCCLLVGLRRQSSTRGIESSPGRSGRRAAVRALAWTAVIVASSRPSESFAFSLNPMSWLAQRPAFGMDVIERVDSEYSSIYVLEKNGIRYLAFSHDLKFDIESMYDPTRPEVLIAQYTRAMQLGLLYLDSLDVQAGATPQGPVSSRAIRGAFLGLGGGRTASYLIRTVPRLHLDVAEIDPQVRRLAGRYFGFSENDRLRVRIEDARVFMKKSPGGLDIVFIDAYRSGFVPFHLVTREFFELVRARLRPGGVIVQNVEPGTLLLDSVLATMRSVFDTVETFEVAGNVIVIARAGAHPGDASLIDRARGFDARFLPTHPTLPLLGRRTSVVPSSDARVLTDAASDAEIRAATRLRGR
jgi:predicted membrane-bound spermidine synthase